MQEYSYRAERSPQALGSSGGHIGVGIALTLATVTLFWLEAEAIWVEAAPPVTTRASTKNRTMVFIELSTFY